MCKIIIFASSLISNQLICQCKWQHSLTWWISTHHQLVQYWICMFPFHGSPHGLVLLPRLKDCLEKRYKLTIMINILCYECDTPHPCMYWTYPCSQVTTGLNCCRAQGQIIVRHILVTASIILLPHRGWHIIIIGNLCINLTIAPTIAFN